MLTLSAAAIIEKNKFMSDSVWLLLLEVQTPEGNIYLVANNENIIWKNQVWTAFPFIIDNIKYNKDEVIEIPIKVSNVSRYIEYYVEYYNGLVGYKVILRVVNSNFLDCLTPELEETFIITSSSVDSQWCTFKLGIAFPLTKRFPVRRILKDYCEFQYKGVECGCTSSLTDCPKTLYGCFVRGNQRRFGGEPSMIIGGIYSEPVGDISTTVMKGESGNPVIIPETSGYVTPRINHDTQSDDTDIEDEYEDLDDTE